MFLTILWVVLALFAVVDFMVVHTAPATPVTGVYATVIGFFKDVNAKLLSLINSIWGDVVKNWVEYVLLGIIYLLLFGLNLPIYLIYVLIGYLLVRLIQDMTGVK